MDFDDLTITGNYSDSDILQEEKETITKNDNVQVKTKQRYGEGEYCQFLTVKKEDSEHLKIKRTNSRK